MVHELWSKVGATMVGSQVAKVLESKNDVFKEGMYVVGYFGWRTHTICDGKNEPTPGFGQPLIVPHLEKLPMSLYLGVLGMPGNTAYFGFLEICQPKAGETVVVTAAAGAVGSHVGQIAKIKGCKVIGFAGTKEKVEWLKKDLLFDHAYNYKEVDVDVALKEAAPNGVDCHFDNVGGEMSSKILRHMNPRGRISVCGSISAYNALSSEAPKASLVQLPMILKELKMEGFMVMRWLDRWEEGTTQNIDWIKEGKLKYKETITEGFENLPKAFKEMLNGKNVGKAVVKA
ncbi:prostaglandin reductase 1-like isoform X2 [Ischnura elegans]|uniref:prostaglandin reductase 1-like isoform X2 n=1 Tax=Ischnura elegans TaxID=197161 RepID=UPI001ED8B7C4|nr:prostaglandin reductase 1-like isoform X2 [Ischnura elegans]